MMKTLFPFAAVAFSAALMAQKDQPQSSPQQLWQLQISGISG